jgi:pimeloyl-ACP methyl ester carboxylesterase
MGGTELVRDLFAPMLMADGTLAAMRPGAFPAAGYTPLDPESPLARLVRDCVDADWDLPYESFDLPVLVATGMLDTMFLQPQALNELILRIPDPHRVDFPDAGHLLPAERPGDLADAVVDFMSAR